MTTRLLFIRHGAHDLLGHVLCGRQSAVPLNRDGERQAAALAAALAGGGVSRVYSSPLARAQQTAAPIARACGLTVTTEAALQEIDMGAWTGATFATLAADPRWQLWNSARSQHCPPGGEAMADVTARIAGWLRRLTARQTVVAVSHADVIKAACCHALGTSVDQLARFDVDPASVTTLLVGEWGMKLAGLNWLSPAP